MVPKEDKDSKGEIQPFREQISRRKNTPYPGFEPCAQGKVYNETKYSMNFYMGQQ